MSVQETLKDLAFLKTAMIRKDDSQCKRLITKYETILRSLQLEKNNYRSLVSVPEDDLATLLMPEDVPVQLIAKRSTADGNCLYNSASMAVYGSEKVRHILRLLRTLPKCTLLCKPSSFPKTSWKDTLHCELHLCDVAIVRLSRHSRHGKYCAPRSNCDLYTTKMVCLNSSNGIGISFTSSSLFSLSNCTQSNETIASWKSISTATGIGSVTMFSDYKSNSLHNVFQGFQLE